MDGGGAGEVGRWSYIFCKNTDYLGCCRVILMNTPYIGIPIQVRITGTYGR